MLFGLWLFSWFMMLSAYLVKCKAYNYKRKEAEYLWRMVALLEGAKSKYDHKIDEDNKKV